MKDRAAIEYKEGQHFLFESTYRSLPYTVVVAALLVIYLLYNNGSKFITLSWFAAMAFIIGIRWLHCKRVVDKHFEQVKLDFNLHLFVYLTLITGIVWVSIYFLSLPYIDEPHLYIIILVYGGMSAGATTTLASYFPSFLAYVLTIFLPVICYGYFLGGLNRIVLSTIFLLYVIALTVVAKSRENLIKRIFFLTDQNKELLEKFEVLSITDELTGLYNRRHFLKTFQEEYNRAKRSAQSFALVSIDIDNFKMVNDNFGHGVGDKLLVYTANYLQEYLRRASDLVFRVGGDEFDALLLNVSEESAKKICYDIRKNYMIEPRFDFDESDPKQLAVFGKISLSLGVVFVSCQTSSNVEQIIEKADKLLYMAKNEGKNEVKYISE